jgi:M6 family metalloprotease-like protein
MRKNLILVFLLFFAPFKLMAVPAYPYPVEVVQPNGSVLTIQLHGDEHFSYTTTADGYLLIQTQQKGYEYARFIDNEIVSTGVTARNSRTAEELSLLLTLDNITPVPHEKIDMFRHNSVLKSGWKQKFVPNPLFGTKKGLVILVNFTDKQFSHAKSDFENMLNQSGYSQNGGTGSAKEYFEISTFNQFSPQFDVFGPYNLSNNMEYYGKPDGNRNDSRPDEMIIEACQAAFSAGTDFSQYDTDNDGFVDNVFVYYAGNNQAEGGHVNTVWPHRSVVNTELTFNGKRLRDYACTSEKRGTGNTMCGIGTFCHEFSHVLGLPDFYNTSTSSVFTLGDWDIMCQGNYNNGGSTPPTYSAYERFFLSYAQPEVLSTEGEYTLEPLITHNKAYIISKDDIHNLNGTNPNPKEYFIIENHQNIGWDEHSKNTGSGTLGHGLLVTRINFSSSTYSNNTVNNTPNALGVDIIEADGTIGSYAGDTYPGTSNKSIFEPKFLDGSFYAEGTLLDIREDYENIIFCYRTCGGIRPNINILPETTDFKTVAGVPSAVSKMRIIGGKLEYDIKLTFTNSNNYQMKICEDNNWTNNITLIPRYLIDSVIDTLIDVRYNPGQPSYKNLHQDFIQAKSVVGSTPIKKVQLTGKSTRAVKVVPPVMLSATKISPYAFQANWKKVNDAVGYYVTVYSKDGQTTEIEEFSDFNIIANSGWHQNFYTTTNVSVPSAPCAVLFTNAEDTLYSPYYPEAVTEIKFWLRSEDKQKEGVFYIEGLKYNGGWDTVATLPVTLSLTGNTKSFTLDAARDYRRFRFSVDEISKKGLVFDNFSATYNANVVLNRLFVESPYVTNGRDSLRVINLVPNKEYICKVQATDKDIQLRYENVTDFSDTEVIATLNGEDANSRKISASIGEDGNVILSINDLDIKDSKGNPLDIYVFSVTGQLVRRIPYSSFSANPGQVVIGGLAKNNTYVISLGSQRKSKFVKVFLN